MNYYDIQDLLICSSFYIQNKINGYEILTKYYVKVYTDDTDINSVDILFKLCNAATLSLAISNLSTKENINELELLS